MTEMIRFLCVCIFLLENGLSTSEPANFNCILDPIEDIVTFLDLSNQQNARFINQAFNHRINKSHSASISAAESMRSYIESLLISIQNRESTRCIPRKLHSEWITKYKIVRYEDLYLRLWPQLLEQSINQNLKQFNLSILHRYHHGAENGNNGLDPVIKTLIQSSQILLRALFCVHESDISEYQSFYSFIYEVTWRYLTVSIGIDPSYRLPAFESVSFITINPDIVDSNAVQNLDRLNRDHGLVVWNPSRILKNREQWSIDKLHFYMTRFLELSQWQDAIQMNEDFKLFLRVEFINKMIDGRNFVDDLSEAELFDYDTFWTICRQTVIGLLRSKKWTTLERVLLVLQASNMPPVPLM